MNEITATAIQTFSAVERDTIERDWESEGISRLTEDEGLWISPEVGIEEDEDFIWGLSIHNNG